jgi:cell division protein FtsB
MSEGYGSRYDAKADRKAETHTCPSCGYEWQHGKHGGHDCLGRLREQLAAANAENQKLRAEVERLKAWQKWRDEPTYPNWGDVETKNKSVQTPAELLEAAKRLVESGDCLGGCGNPYGKHTGFAAQFDEIAVGEAYQALTAELDQQRQRAERAERELGLLANPAIAAAVKQHIEERYKSLTPDASFSQVHKVYQTGCALTGPSVVVEWDDKQFWFAPVGDGVEIDEYPSRRTTAEQQVANLRKLLDAFWPIVNRYRGELIDKKIGRTATPEELAELARLQELTGRYQDIVAPLPFAELEAMEKRLRIDAALKGE